MSELREHLSLLKKFLHSDFRKGFLWCTMTMLLSILAGFALYQASPDVANELIDRFNELVEQAGVLDAETGTISVFALLRNNWTAMLAVILYGFIPFICFPVFSLFSNGLLIGVLAGLYQQSEELTMTMYFAGILPHGIFEFPALLLAVSCGMYLCRNMGYAFLRTPKRPSIPEVVSDLLRVLLFLIAPLNVAAAFIEAYLTPMIMASFL